MDLELESKIKQAQEDSWEEGYFDGRDGDPEDSERASWPSHYRQGYRAAKEDAAHKVQQS
jgi:hypothetical protein